MKHFTLRGAVREERHCVSDRRSQGLQACMSVKFNSPETLTHIQTLSDTQMAMVFQSQRF